MEVKDCRMDYNPYGCLYLLLDLYCEGYGAGCAGCRYTARDGCTVYEALLIDAPETMEYLRENIKIARGIEILPE